MIKEQHFAELERIREILYSDTPLKLKCLQLKNLKKVLTELPETEFKEFEEAIKKLKKAIKSAEEIMDEAFEKRDW